MAGWKAFISLDALLFFDLKGGESISRKALVADRIPQCERQLGVIMGPRRDADGVNKPR